MSLSSLVFDLIVLAVVVLCAIYYSRKGFVSGVFSFFGTLIALVVAAFAAQRLSGAIFTHFFRDGMIENVTGTLAETGIHDLDTLMHQVIGFLPEYLVDTITEALNPVLDFSAADIAIQVVDQVVQPMLTPLIMIILFFALFALMRILIGVIRSLAVGLARMPALNMVNSILGAAIGVLIGVLYVFIALCVVWGYDRINPAAAVEQSYFGSSLVFSLLDRFNFFAL